MESHFLYYSIFFANREEKTFRSLDSYVFFAIIKM